MKSVFYQMLYRLLIFSCIHIQYVSCTNPFTTRDVETPSISDRSDTFDPPVAASIVLSNFRYALIQKNISNYMNCFVDPELAYAIQYRFIPDPSSEIDKFRNWDIQSEQNYITTVFSLTEDVSLEFTEEPVFSNISQSEDSVVTDFFRYDLRIDFADGPQIYSGSARMKLVKNVNAMWSIYYWEDISEPGSDEQSWSYLKANYKN
jgi:hypothetical protein